MIIYILGSDISVTLNDGKYRKGAYSLSVIENAGKQSQKELFYKPIFLDLHHYQCYHRMHRCVCFLIALHYKCRKLSYLS